MRSKTIRKYSKKEAITLKEFLAKPENKRFGGQEPRYGDSPFEELPFNTSSVEFEGGSPDISLSEESLKYYTDEKLDNLKVKAVKASYYWTAHYTIIVYKPADYKL